MTLITPHEPIAIVGIGCAFPGARGPDAFWRLLAEGREAIQEVPPERFDIKPFHDPVLGKPGKIVTTRAGFVDDVDLFDATLFGISPREAESMDPQQRLLLEVTWAALEDAGITRTRLSEHTASVYIGASSADYGDMQLQFPDSSSLDVYTLSGTARSILAGRTSHAFDLKGASVAVDTACSSSLVAVHLACESIWNRACDLAVAGGVNLILTPAPWAVLSLARIISPDGRARVFDARANGFVRGEGAGVVVLKPLAQAQRDGDPIYAVIRGSAINNDGRNSSVMTPNGLAQEAVLRAAYRNAGISPGDVHYVEAHGTGTAVGDPIEVRALGAVIAEGRRPDQPCRIGSVKTNIGHLEAAAGISGLIKAALCVKHRAIPPSLHYEIPNPAVPWDELPLVVQREFGVWPEHKGPALAGVSSFGISGTNVHIVLAEAPDAPCAQPPIESTVAQLLPLSAHTPEALDETLARFQSYLQQSEDGPRLEDVCYTASMRRTHHAYRAAFTGRSRRELIEQIQMQRSEGATAAHGCDGCGGPVFVFSGQGAQFWPMDAGLLARFSVYLEMLRRCEELLVAEGVDWLLLQQLTAQEGASRLHQAEVCQPAIFSCQVALAALWRSWGITPSAVIGHSLGEVAAAYVAGALSLEQAMHLVVKRGEVTSQAAGKGEMALVGLSMSAAEEAIRDYAPALAVAVSNSPTNCVLSGAPEALAAVKQRLEQRQVFVRRLPAIDYAAHSPQMEPLKHQLAAALETLTPQPTAIPFYSTVAAHVLDGGALGAYYWADNLREPVRFDQTVRAALADGHRDFLEVHPTQVLLRPLQEVMVAQIVAGIVCGSLQREADGAIALLRSLAELYRCGYAVRWEDVYSGSPGQHVPLPPLPLHRRRYWLAGIDFSSARRRSPHLAPGGNPLLGMHLQSAANPNVHTLETELACNRPSYLTDHRIYGAAVLPAAAYVEIALALAKDLDPAGNPSVTGMAFEKALVLPDEGEVALQIVAEAATDALNLTYFSRPIAQEPPVWTRHATGAVRFGAPGEPEPRVPRLSPGAFMAAAEATILNTEYYAAVGSRGLEYGAAFQGIGQVWRSGMEVLAHLGLPESVKTQLSSYQVHPVLLDLAFQCVAAIVPALERQTGTAAYLPVALGSLEIHGVPVQAVYAHATLHPVQAGASSRLTADVALLDGDGCVLVESKALVLQQVAGKAALGAEDDLGSHLYRVMWQPAGVAVQNRAESSAGEHWLVIGAVDHLGEAVARRLRTAGNECVLIDTRWTPRDEVTVQVAQLLAGQERSGAPFHGVLFLAGLEDQPAYRPTGEEVVTELLYCTQALLEHEAAVSPRLWVVTRGAQPVGDDRVCAPGQAALWGLARTIALEAPSLRCSMLDLATGDASGDAELVSREILAGMPENQIAYRDGERLLARLVRGAAADAPAMRSLAPEEGYRLQTTKPGILDCLVLTSAERVPPRADQVEIRVHSAGLNFLDVLTAMGLRPDQDGAELVLGMECAGTVSRVGCDVTSFRVGDPVMAVAPSSMGAYALTSAGLAVAKPDGLSFQAAATVPIAYLTAYYALHTLGRIRRGERILIHAAAGGVGLATVYLAQRAGATVFATAGSPEKRDYLRRLGVDYVMDSRSLDFAAEIMTYTHGEGVDLVLNSLAGEVIPKSLATLRANGRFLEIGKRDIYGQSKLNMGLLKKNIAFFAIDLIPLLNAQPEFCKELFSELAGYLRNGELPPLPYQEFPLSKAESAFRTMAQAKHIGKIVLVAEPDEDAEPVRILPRPRNELRRNGTYLITGGLGGIGLTVANWLVEHGARHLVLVSRSAPSADVASQLAELQARGAEVHTVQADVTDAEALGRVLDTIATKLPPLVGVFHAAGVLDDGLLSQLDGDCVHQVMAPKADGAWQLHELTRTLDLDLFVLFSSATSVLGAPGQANYAAANAYLDGLAHYRRGLGLPALSINWGAWAEVGMAAHGKQREHMAALGITPMAPDLALALLDQVLASADTQVTAMQAEWPRLLQHFKLPLLAGIAAEQAGNRVGTQEQSALQLQARLCALDDAARRAAILEVLQKQLSQVLRTSLNSFDADQPLRELGIDSLMTVELVNRIETTLGVSIPMATLLQGPTLANLSEKLSRLIGEPASGEVRPVQVQDTIQDAQLARRVADLVNEAVLDPAITMGPACGSVYVAPGHLLLTGATGFLGAFLLRDLLRETRAQIACLVRARNPVHGYDRLGEAWARTFPDEPLAMDRITIIPGDLAEADFGVDAHVLDDLADKIDGIVHSGAEVNWLAPYAQLKPANVLGVETILRLAARRSIPLHYVSSLAVFPIMGASEARILDESSALEQDGVLYGGYAQSKWVAEKLVAAAAERGLPVMIYRPSLIAGDSVTGVWQADSVIANMLRSWAELGIAPDLDADFDLAPVDYVSRTIVQGVLRGPSGGMQIAHLNNAHPVALRDMVAWLNECGYRVETAPYARWRAVIVARSDVREEAVFDALGPLFALELTEDVGWLACVPHFESERTRQMLGGMSCPPLDFEVFRKYVDYLQRSQRLKIPAYG